MNSTPIADMRSLASALATNSASAPYNLSITGRGVRAGASIPYQVATSKPLSPCSSRLGISGAAAERFAVVTPSARIRPLRTCGIMVAIGSKIICTRPASRSGTATPVPLYGTCNMSIPVMRLNNSPERCPVLPVPADAKVSWPGLALASATSSFTLFAGNEGVTASRLTAMPSGVMGLKSRTGSYGSLAKVAALTAKVSDPSSSV